MSAALANQIGPFKSEMSVRAREKSVGVRVAGWVEQPFDECQQHHACNGRGHRGYRYKYGRTRSEAPKAGNLTGMRAIGAKSF